MKIRSKRERIILGLTAGVAILFLIDRFCEKGYGSGHNALDGKIALQERQIEEDLEALRNKAKIIREYQRYIRKVDKNTLPGTTGLIHAVQSAAQNSRAKIIDLAPMAVARAGDLPGNAVTVTVELPWAALGPFAYELSQSPRLLRIEHADIHVKTPDGAILVGRFTIISRNS